MLYWDRTKAGTKNRHSGLDRVAKRLSDELSSLCSDDLAIIRWDQKLEAYVDSNSSEAICFGSSDTVICSEVFSFSERKAYESWVASFPGKRIMIFHDAIPLQYPETTWPHSVARHPYYLQELASCWKLISVSKESARILKSYWDWSEIENQPEVAVIELGADSIGERVQLTERKPSRVFSFLMTGILEPRKNQLFILACCESLWKKGIEFNLDIVGRKNPHFGKAIYKEIKRLSKMYPYLKYHGVVSDKGLEALYEASDALLFPSTVEGFGLPVVESLWRGIPVLSNRLPSAELYKSKGVVLIDELDESLWAHEMEKCIQDNPYYEALLRAVGSANLKTWSDSAVELRDIISGEVV